MQKDERYIKMSRKIKESVVPFVALMSLFIFLAFLIVEPLGKPLLWSIVLSYFAYPFYRYMHTRVFGDRYGRLGANAAAALTTAVILIFMCIPMLLLGLFLTRESFKIYDVAVRSGLLTYSYSDLLIKLRGLPVMGKYLYDFDFVSGMPFFEAMIGSAVNWLTGLLRRISGEVVGNAFKIFYLLAIVTVSSFFIVRDGHVILSYIRDIMPLQDEAKQGIIDRSTKMLRAVVYGIVVTAGIQGTLGGVGWWYVELPHPLFFGFVMFITGMIPFVGTPVVWIPGSLYLLASDDLVGCALLLAWGFGVVSMVDNFIRPMFISEESKIHMLVIFVGIFGGLFNWGFLGLFIGPLILSLGIFILDLYRAIVVEKIKVDGGRFE